MSDEKFTFFYQNQFSQWNMKPFVVNRITYSCAEQYMMAHKALLFLDGYTWQKIMFAKHPGKHKSLGRDVKRFDQQVWDENAEEIVFEGNYAKFTQIPDYKQKLLDTIGTTLVECTEKDLVWGNGINIKDPARFDKAKWTGTSLLGKTLTRVRDKIELEESELRALGEAIQASEEEKSDVSAL